MKKEFAQLIREMRVALHPQFKSITNDSNLSAELLDKALADLDEKQHQMITESGYTQAEFDGMCREHFMDFSSSDPDEWVIKYNPDYPHIIVNH